MRNIRFLNKISVILISLFIAASFAGCNNGTKTSSTASSSKSSSQSSSSVSEASSKSTPPSQKSSSAAESSTPAKTSSKVSSSKASSNSLSCTVTIDATKGGEGMIASSKKVEITKGESVFDALKKCCGSKTSIASKGAGSSVYVAGIGGLSEFDKGSQSGWVYLVNGKIASQSAGAYKLNGGENIKWVYTLDMGRTEAKAG